MSSNQSSQQLNVKYNKKTQRYNEVNSIDVEKMELKKYKQNKLDHLYNQNYQPANYAKALQYKNSRSYKKKLPNGSYREIQTFEDVEVWKHFGLGTYFFIDYMRRIVWLFFIFSIIEAIRIYINSVSNGLNNSTPTFSSYLIGTTIGNYAGGVLTIYDNYIMAIVPGITYALLFVFYFYWKGHYFGQIDGEEEDMTVVKPQKFCLQVQGMDETDADERELQRLFGTFGPVYEVSLVRRFKNKLSYFEELDQLEQQIKQQELQIILGSGDQQNMVVLKREKQKLSKFINTLRISPKIISAFVHFQYQKSKVDCLGYYNDHYLFDSGLHSCFRDVCCCCISDVQDKYLYRGKPLTIKSTKVPIPDDINWESYQITGVSRFFRVLVAIIIILVFIFISTSIIALCSIYINSHSYDCDGINTAINCLTASCNPGQKKCYCNDNVFASLNNQSISTYCGSLIQEYQISQAIQYAVVAISGITNFLFGFVVDKIVNFTRPASYTSGLIGKTTVFTIFIIFNSIFIPILIYSNIYGFISTNYASLLTIISSNLNSMLQVSQLTFYMDFQRIWYKNVSPIFTNFITFDIIAVWIFFILGKCTGDTEGLKDDQGNILQKSMNDKMTEFKYNLYKQFSYFNLIFFMAITLSGGVPVLIPLAFLDLFSRYITSRMLIQANSSKIQGLGEDFMAYPLTFLPITIIIGAITSCWMLTANSSLIPPSLNIQIPLNMPSYFYIPQLVRELYLPYFLIIALLMLVWFLFDNTLVRFLSWLSSLCFEKKQVLHPYHTRPYSDYAKTMNVLSSYNIRNNDRMRNVILNLQKYLVVHQDKF